MVTTTTRPRPGLMMFNSFIYRVCRIYFIYVIGRIYLSTVLSILYLSCTSLSNYPTIQPSKYLTIYQGKPWRDPGKKKGELSN